MIKFLSSTVFKRLATSLCFALCACGGTTSPLPTVSQEPKQIDLVPIPEANENSDKVRPTPSNQDPLKTYEMTLTFQEEYGGPITADEVGFKAVLNGKTLPAIDDDNHIKLSIPSGQYILKAIVPGRVGAKQHFEFIKGHPSTLHINLKITHKNER